jgi:hypothetical protein
MNFLDTFEVPESNGTLFFSVYTVGPTLYEETITVGTTFT